MLVNDFRPHKDSLFRGATYMRERLIREYIRYVKTEELNIGGLHMSFFYICQHLLYTIINIFDNDVTS